MKKILATTAIALVMANGAFAESHMNADGTPKDTATSTDTTAAPADGSTSTDTTAAPADGAESTDTTEAPADGSMSTDSATSTDTTMAPADGAASTDSATSTDSTMAPADGTAATDGAASTDGTMTTDSATAPADSSTGMATDSASSAPSMTMDGYETVMNADVTTDELTGTKVYGPDEDEVGEIGDLVVGEEGKITDVIVDVGGFLGLGEKPVSIAFDSVQIMKQTDGDDMRAYVSMTEDQLKELPKYESPNDAAAMDAATTDSTTMDSTATDSSTMEAAPADGTATDAAPADGTAPAANN